MSSGFDTQHVHDVTQASIDHQRRLRTVREILDDTGHPLHSQLLAIVDAETDRDAVAS